jgi:hypothetical protein
MFTQSRTVVIRQKNISDCVFYTFKLISKAQRKISQFLLDNAASLDKNKEIEIFKKNLYYQN